MQKQRPKNQNDYYQAYLFQLKISIFCALIGIAIIF